MNAPDTPRIIDAPEVREGQRVHVMWLHEDGAWRAIAFRVDGENLEQVQGHAEEGRVTLLSDAPTEDQPRIIPDRKVRTGQEVRVDVTDDDGHTWEYVTGAVTRLGARSFWIGDDEVGLNEPNTTVYLINDAPTEDGASGCKDDAHLTAWTILQGKLESAKNRRDEARAERDALAAKLERVRELCAHARTVWPDKPWLTVSAVEMAMEDGDA